MNVIARAARMSVYALAIAMAGLVLPVQRVDAQPATRVFRIGVLAPQQSSEPATVQREPFERGLREAGWVAGKNVVIEYRYAEGDIERLGALANELVKLKVDVLVARAPQAIRAAQRATSTIPIVMAASADPVRSGFVASFARPGGNITGLAIVVDDLGAKQLEALKSVLPHLERLAVLVDPRMAVDQDKPFYAELESAARALNIQVQIIEVNQAAEIEPAFATMKKAEAQALLVRADPHILEPHAAEVVALAARYRIPAIYPWRMYTDAGGLMSYSTGLSDFHYRAASYVDRILRGANPGTLPVEAPMTFELVVNNRTAQALGLTLPRSLLVRAEVIP